MLSEFRTLLCVFSVLCAASAFAQTPLLRNPLLLPDKLVIDEARMLVEKMVKAERGPYKRLRWFCADGTLHEPRPYACAERGGGKQHAEYSEARQALAGLGWHVGTIFAAADVEYWTGADGWLARLAELPLEKYLIDIDDGWILRKAKNYRGRLQAEDEEYTGRQILITLLSSPDWVEKHYLLLRELVRVIPHGSGSDLNRSIRRLALEIAQQVPAFEMLRIEIHTSPSVHTIGRVRRWLETEGHESSNDNIQILLAQLVQLYGEAGRQSRLEKLHKIALSIPTVDSLQQLITAVDGEGRLGKIQRLSKLLATIRTALKTKLSAGQRLQLLDGMSDIEAELRMTANLMLEKNDSMTRRDVLIAVSALVEACYGSGLLSADEYGEIRQRTEAVLLTPHLSFADYRQLSTSLNLASIWAMASIRYTFAETLNRYIALDYRANGFTDDILRSSPMLQLAELARYLLQDTQQLSGVYKSIARQPASALLALNPGVALGRLRILDEEDLRTGASAARDEIVVLPQTVSELSPVAGVMTLGEGNMLSHVQLLARNFGIPNISINQSLLDLLTPMQGKRVVLIADNEGSVVLQEYAELPESIQQLISPALQVPEKLEVPQADLSQRRILPLAELSKELSGILVGPKAANLGELNRLFPGKVAPALALPFGFFLDNVNRHSDTHWGQLAELYTAYRQQQLSEEELHNALVKLRKAVAQSELSPHHRDTLREMMQATFGADDSYGLFLRSDTNVEDLPGFTGAGLSETLPNIVGTDKQIAAIPQIWASVLADRAIAWRSNLLRQAEHVYPSVLLMQSVAADKSGVLITADLLSRRAGITTSTAWGVGGAVAGEASESLLLLDDGSEVLISQAKTPYRRFLAASGGVQWLPAADGAVLSVEEKQQLRQLAIEVHEKYPPLRDSQGKEMPWDIEFGFVNEELKLFQIRPLVERRQQRPGDIIKAFRRQQPAVPESLDLESQPLRVPDNSF